MARAKEAAAEAVTIDGSAAAISPAAASSSTSSRGGGGSASAAAPAGTAEEQSSSSSSETGETKRLLSPSSGCAAAVAQLPGAVRFALAVVLSFALEELGRAAVGRVTEGEMGRVVREAASWSGREGFVLVAWRLFTLALGWLGDYDGYDLAALALLSHGPATFLVSVFYGIRALTAGAYLAVEVVSAFVPFLLFRQLSGAHSAAPGIPNRDIVVDRGIQALTSAQSALVYSVVVFLASRYLLPDVLVLYFEGVPTITPAADAGFLGFGNATTQLLSLLFGLAARTFIFTPLVATARTAEDERNAEFDPVSATLAQTVAWNLWGYTTRTKVSLVRTAVAMLVTAVGTYLDTALAIKGVEPYGAAVYASVWVTAALVTGLSLRYVGSV